MKNAFLDPVSRTLKAHGFIESNAPGDITIEVPDDFGLEPGKWQHDGADWVEDDTAGAGPSIGGRH
jgi:hypothetical protein